MLMRVLLTNFLRWYRQLPVFKWHNNEIFEWKAASKGLSIVLAEERDRCNLLQARIDKWISRAEGSRYKQLYEELKNKPHYLEQHANRQAKMLNWIRAEMRDMYPTLVDKAKGKTSATD